MKNNLLLKAGRERGPACQAGLRLELQTLSRAKAAVKNALYRL